MTHTNAHTRCPGCRALTPALGALFLVGLLAGGAQASKPCGNSWIADNKTCHVGTGSSGTTPAPSAPPILQVTPAPQVSRLFLASCEDARQRGLSDLPFGSLEYARHLDRDHDGVACESGGDDRTPDGTAAPSREADRPASVPASRPDVQGLTLATVTEIIDGRTLRVLWNYQPHVVRLIGLGTPFPLGKTVLEQLTPLQSTVWVELDPAAPEAGGFTPAYVWLGPDLVNWTLLDAGAPTEAVPAAARYAAALSTVSEP